MKALIPILAVLAVARQAPLETELQAAMQQHILHAFILVLRAGRGAVEWPVQEEKAQDSLMVHAAYPHLPELARTMAVVAVVETVTPITRMG